MTGEPKPRLSGGTADRRRPRGRPFPKGTSGNPGGRPTTPNDVREKFLPNVAAVMTALLHTALTKRGTSVGVSAAKEFLDRVLGKAPQPIVGEDGGAPININAPTLVEALRRYADARDDDDAAVTPRPALELSDSPSGNSPDRTSAESPEAG